MFVIVVGCGRLGSRLALTLSELEHDVVVIGNPNELKRLSHGFDGVSINGNPIDEDVLKKAGIEKAQALVAVTADDNVNVMVAEIAEEIFSVPMVLARISDPEREEFFTQLGLKTVSPTNTGIHQILEVFKEKRFAPLKGFLHPEVAGVNPLPEWIGRPLKELKMLNDTQVVGILRGERVIPLEPKMVVHAADVLIVIGK